MSGCDVVALIAHCSSLIARHSIQMPPIIRRAVALHTGLLILLLLAACAGSTPQAATPAPSVAPAAATPSPSPTTTVLTPPPSPVLPTATPSPSPGAAAPATAAATPDGQLAGQTLVEALRQGGYVIYFRHAATDHGGVDSVEWPREQQRNLSETGRADAEAIGRAFRALGIPVGRVLASPFYRTIDTAQLAFDRAEIAPELLGLLSDDAGRAERAAALRRLLSTPPEPGLNTVLVAHLSNLQEVAGVSLPEGGAAIFQPLGPGGFRLVARLTPAEWTALASLQS